MAQELRFKLEKFEGPLDLLLHLIERDKIDIFDIPIVQITAEYMDYITQMEEEDLDLVSDFLVMAATLLEIKSRMLLPKEVDEETGEEVDPRAELVARLLEYRKYKYMAEQLENQEDEAELYFYKPPTIPEGGREVCTADRSRCAAEGCNPRAHAKGLRGCHEAERRVRRPGTFTIRRDQAGEDIPGGAHP